MYKQTILDHAKHPRNFFRLEDAQECSADNPLCGDSLTLFFKRKDGRINEIAFQAQGCALLLASSSIMTELVKQKTTEELVELFGQFHRYVLTGTGDVPEQLKAFSHVHHAPMRAKCVSLPWHALVQGVENK